MLDISTALRDSLEKDVKSPQLILEIEGLPTFSSIPVQRYVNYGDLINYGDSGLYYGGLVEDTTILPWIDLKKSTNQISQQIIPDKGGFSSITNFDVCVVDKDQRVSEMILSGNLIDDILGAKARLYLSLEGAGHPHDSVLFFNGIVSGVPVGAGFVKFNLSSSEKLKNLEIFPKVSTTLTANALIAATSFTVESTNDFLTPAPTYGLRCYLIVDDEYIEYTGKTATSFTGLSRAQYGTIAAAYSSGQNIESAYRLTGSLKNLALRLMISGSPTNYYSGQILAINSYGVDTIQNAIFVDDYYFARNTGAVSGDSITITGATVGANNITTQIVEIGQTSGISYIVVSDALTTEGSGASIAISSLYNVFPKFAGLEMTPDQVDVPEFVEKDSQFSAQFFEYDFFIKDSIVGSEFINEQILFPSGCYSIPRKAKTSLGITAPPLYGSQAKTIDETNVTNASGLVIERSINQNFYNAVIYKYDKDEVTDKFNRGKIFQSANSTNRIKVANKPLVIEAEGIKPTGFTDKVNILSNKTLSRYQYGAESIEVRVAFGVGFDIEIGDVVLLKGENLKISDSKQGNRNFRPRLFEVQNKTMYLSGQPITLKLVDTAYNLFGRYGVFSPSSKIGSGSTTTNIKLQRSFGTNLGLGFEGDKYKNILGAKLKIRSENHSYSYERYIQQIDPTDKNAIILSSPLPSAPLSGYIVEVASYSSSVNPDDEILTKTLYCFWDAQIPVASGTSQTVFTINSADLAKISEGSSIYLHDADYTNQSPEVKVTDITGTTITVDTALGFTPNNTYFIELNTFPDNGQAYRWY